MPNIVISDQDRQLFNTDKYAFINKFTGILAQNAHIVAPKVEVLTVEAFRRQSGSPDGLSTNYDARTGTIRTTQEFLNRLSAEEAVAALGHELSHKVQAEKGGLFMVNAYYKAEMISNFLTVLPIVLLALRVRKIQPLLARLVPESLPLIHTPPLAKIFGFGIISSVVFSKLFIWQRRKLEYDADKMSAELTGNKQWMIDVIGKLFSFKKGNYIDRDSTYPSYQHRIEALEKLQDSQ